MKEKWFGARISGPSAGHLPGVVGAQPEERPRVQARAHADELVDPVRLAAPDARVVGVEELLGPRVLVDLRLHRGELVLLRHLWRERTLPRVRTFALSAVGADRPGIIAAIADRLVAHGLNVTDSQMGILRGFFAMTLVLESERVDEDALRADLAAATEELQPRGAQPARGDDAGALLGRAARRPHSRRLGLRRRPPGHPRGGDGSARRGRPSTSATCAPGSSPTTPST